MCLLTFSSGKSDPWNGLRFSVVSNFFLFIHTVADKCIDLLYIYIQMYQSSLDLCMHIASPIVVDTISVGIFKYLSISS